MDVSPTEASVAQDPEREVPAILLERAEEHPSNPFLEVFETGRQLHACLDGGARWLIFDFGPGPPPLADVAMAFALVRAGRRAARAGGALVVVVGDPAVGRAMHEAEPAAAGLEIAPTLGLARERISQLRRATAACVP